MLALLCLGQCGRGIGGRFAFGGRLGCRQILFLRGLRGILGRLLGCRRSRGGGGYLVLDVRQGSVGQFLLRRRPGQLLRRGVGQVLRILLGCLCLGQGRLGRVGRLALGGGFFGRLLLLCGWLAGILGNLLGLGRGVLGRLLGCRRSRGGGGHLVLALAKAASAAFFCVSASASICGAVLA